MATTPASPRLRQTIERLVQVRFMSFNHPQTTFLSKNQGFGENLKCQKLEKNSSNQFESPLSMKKNLESRSNTHLFRHLSHPFSIFEVTSPKGGVIQYSATHPTYWSTPPLGQSESPGSDGTSARDLGKHWAISSYAMERWWIFSPGNLGEKIFWVEEWEKT